MKYKKLLTSAVAGLCVLAMTGCGGSGGASKSMSKDGKGTVRMWVMEGSLKPETQKVLTEQFAKENPGSTLKIEVQQWDGIVAKLQTSLASKNESPDLVELGNTQTSTFTSIGALADVTSMKDELGGKDLIQSFIDAATIDGKIYAMPMYAGARGVYYRKDLFAKAGLKVPTTIEEFKQAVTTLQEKNPEGTKDFSGMYMAAVDIHGVESYLFADGFEYAKQEGGKWVGQVNSPQSLKALKDLQEIFQKGTKFGDDSQASQKSFERYFSESKTGVLIGTGNVGVKIDKKLWDEDKVGVFAIPSAEAGKPGQTFAGGSNIAIAQNSPNPELAKKALKAFFSEPVQTSISKADGWVPGNTKYSKDEEGPFKDIAKDIIENSKLTPNSPEWGSTITDSLSQFFGKIAKGEDVKKVADDFNAELEKVMNKK